MHKGIKIKPGKEMAIASLIETTTKPQDEVEGALLLDVVVAKGAAILKLLACEDQPLLVRGDPFLVLE